MKPLLHLKQDCLCVGTVESLDLEIKYTLRLLVLLTLCFEVLEENYLYLVKIESYDLDLILLEAIGLCVIFLELFGLSHCS